MGREGGVGIQSMEMGYRQEDRRKNILGRDCNIGQNTFKNNQNTKYALSHCVRSRKKWEEK